MLGGLHHDPSPGIKRPKGGKIRSWTDAEVTQFEKRWPVGTKQRLGFALHLYTGQRRSDVHRMTWGDVTGDSIRVVHREVRGHQRGHEVANACRRCRRSRTAVLAFASQGHR